jgi:putative transposase
MTRKPDTISFWRGRLPHWEVAEGRYFVTIHLAGAIPQQGQERIRDLAAAHDILAECDVDGRHRLQRLIYAEMESWLDRAEVVSHLGNPALARSIMESIAFRHGRTWNVIEYVVMPSHIHLFFEVLDTGLKKALEQFKRWTGHAAAKVLDLEAGRFWQDEWFDHWSRSDEEDEKIIHYIRHNPVKARLVEDYRAWPYGSWNDLSLGTASEELDARIPK